MSIDVHVMCLLCVSCSSQSQNASINFGANPKRSATKLRSALFRMERRANMARPALTFALGSRLKGVFLSPSLLTNKGTFALGLRKADL